MPLRSVQERHVPCSFDLLINQNLSRRTRPKSLRVVYPTCRTQHVEDTCQTRACHVSHSQDTCPQHVMKIGHRSCTKNDLGSCFLIQIAAMRCFGVQLRVIFPYAISRGPHPLHFTHPSN
jgi:hypothetical protein